MGPTTKQHCTEVVVAVVEEAEAEGEGVVAVEAVVAALIRPATTGAAVQAAAAAEQKP